MGEPSSTLRNMKVYIPWHAHGPFGLVCGVIVSLLIVDALFTYICSRFVTATTPWHSRCATTTTPSRPQTRAGGDSLLHSLDTAATSRPPPSLARKREVGVDLLLLHTTASTVRLLCHDDHPLSLANARGSFLASFTRLAAYHDDHPLSPANASWGSFSPRFTRNHRQTTAPSLANARGSFSARFTRDRHHVTTTNPSRSQMRGGGPFHAQFTRDRRHITTTAPLTPKHGSPPPSPVPPPPSSPQTRSDPPAPRSKPSITSPSQT